MADKILVDSAGCNTTGGGRMSRPAREALREDQIPFDVHISKRFTVQEYKQAKIVVALDEYMLRQAKSISNGDPERKIRLFKDFDGKAFNVDDPFHATNNIKEAYRFARDRIKIGCSVLLNEILDADKD